MATDRDFSPSTHMQYFTDDDDSESDDDREDEDDQQDDINGEEPREEEDSSRGLKGAYLMCGPGRRRGSGGWSLGQVLDPRAKWVQEWNRVFLLVCATGLFVDPLFFYALSISDTCMCLFVDGWFAITVTALRCMTDALHLWNMWLHLKMTKGSSFVPPTNGPREDSDETADRTAGKPRSDAIRYLKAKKGFFFDLFVILPLPQVLLRIPPLIQ